MDTAKIKLQDIPIIDRLLGIDTALSWQKDNFSMDEINQFLLNPVDEYDFNFFSYPLRSRHDLQKAISAAKATVNNPDAPWKLIKCHCGGVITLTHRELQWHRDNGYACPQYCACCMVRYLG